MSQIAYEKQLADLQGAAHGSDAKLKKNKLPKKEASQRQRPRGMGPSSVYEQLLEIDRGELCDRLRDP